MVQEGSKHLRQHRQSTLHTHYCSFSLRSVPLCWSILEHQSTVIKGITCAFVCVCVCVRVCVGVCVCVCV